MLESELAPADVRGGAAEEAAAEARAAAAEAAVVVPAAVQRVGQPGHRSVTPAARIDISASKSSIRRFVITEKAPTSRLSEFLLVGLKM